MTYTVYLSNPSKTPISVADLSVDQSTSINLVGRNASGYGQAIAENFIHLLENFSYTTPPGSPLEGQLWYDTTIPNNKILKVYDGSTWTPSGGLYSGTSDPVDGPYTVKNGDLWADSATFRLKMRVAGAWKVIGPELDNVRRTGTFVDILTDALGDPHEVVLTYVNDSIITITAKETFTPNPSITGFSQLIPGLNVSTQAFGGTSAKVSGLANTALSLQVSTQPAPVPADNFLRADTAGTINGFLRINSDGGIKIGNISQTFLIEKQINDGVMINRSDSARLRFRVRKNDVDNEILTLDGNLQRVGINNDTPTQSLDVNGSAKFSGTLTITSAASNAVNVSGGGSFGTNLNVLGNVTVSNTGTFRRQVIVGYLGSGGTGIVPATNGTYDIGSVSNPFRTVYAKNFATTSTAFSMVQTGMITLYSGAGIPDGWAVCDGSTVPRAGGFQQLYDLLGTTYGEPTTATPSPSWTFTDYLVLPNLTGVTVVNPQSPATPPNPLPTVRYIIKY